MNKKHKTFSTTLNYIEHFLILASTFASLIGIPIEIASSTVTLKTCAIITGIKKYKPMIKKKKKKHDKIVFLAKSKSNSIEAYIK